MVWLWYSFIITASYGGELRAFLLKPKLNSPINSYKDVVDSGLPWKVADYDDGVWEFLAYLNDIDGIQEFVRDKHDVQYKDFPFEYVSKTLFCTIFKQGWVTLSKKLPVHSVKKHSVKNHSGWHSAKVFYLPEVTLSKRTGVVMVSKILFYLRINKLTTKANQNEGLALAHPNLYPYGISFSYSLQSVIAFSAFLFKKIHCLTFEH